eukprot:jgi/Botrbrau1/11138/Bobra.331_1s0008.1
MGIHAWTASILNAPFMFGSVTETSRASSPLPTVLRQSPCCILHKLLVLTHPASARARPSRVHLATTLRSCQAPACVAVSACLVGVTKIMSIKPNKIPSLSLRQDFYFEISPV